MTKAFNPLERLAQVKRASAPFQQSREPAPEPAPVQVFDTITPAVSPNMPRRFDLGDLPSVAGKLFPYLKESFPHLNEKMYGGWLRGCIQDNNCHFTVIEGLEGKTVSMAFLEREAVNPIPYVDIKFVFGQPGDLPKAYEDIVKWAESMEVSRIQQDQYATEDLAPLLPRLKLEKRIVTLLRMKE